MSWLMFCFFWFQAIRCHQFTGSRRFVYDKTLNNHFSMYETQSKSPLRIEITWAFMLLLTTPVIHKHTHTCCCCCSKWAVLSLSFSACGVVWLKSLCIGQMCRIAFYTLHALVRTASSFSSRLHCDIYLHTIILNGPN